GVVDSRNRLVWTIGDFLYRITEPALRPIRNLLPSMGGLDLSPWVLILLLGVTQRILLPRLFAAIVFGNYRDLLL
ncbi:MAG: YggT family protein, partial [Janthinobacterium lividum]